MRNISNYPVRIVLALVACMAAPATVPAQLQWDPNMTSGAALGGTGTWTASTVTNWYNGSADVAWDSNIAVFGGTAGTVTIDSVAPPSATGVIFNTTGYTLGGAGTLTVNGGTAGYLSTGTATIGIGPNLSATINAIIGSSGTVYVGQGNTTTYSGTLTLGGANAFNTGLNITGGATVIASSDTNFGPNPATSAINGANNNILINNGTLRITANLTLASHRIIQMPDAGVNANGVTQIGGGGTITVDSGATLSIPTPFDPLSNVCIITGAGNTTVTGLFSCFSPNGHLIKNGSGNLTINNTGNTGSLTSDITINSGTLVIDQSNSLGNNTANTFGEPLTINGGALSDTRTGTTQFINGTRAIVIGANGGTINLTGTSSTFQTYAGNASGPVGGVVPTGGLQGPGALTITGALANAAAVLAFNGVSSTLQVPNTNTGPVTVSNATLWMGNSTGGTNASNLLSQNSALILANGSIFNLAGWSQTIASLSDGAGAFGSVTLGNSTAAVLTLGGDNTNTTFSGVISGGGINGGIVKNGTGTFTLAGANTFGTGAGTGTTVNNGTLLATNTTGSATGSGFVNVLGTGTLGSGGTLGGTGTMTPTGTNLVAISSTTAGSQGGIVSPGLGGGTAGTLNVSVMQWNPLGRYVFAYNSTNTTTGSGVNNFISGSGMLDLSNLSSSAPFDLNLQALSPGTSTQHTYVIADFTGGIIQSGGINSPTFFTNPTNISNLFTFSGTYNTLFAPVVSVVAGPGGGSDQAIDLTFTTPAPPTSLTWTGTVSGSWMNANNWNPASAPISNINNQLTFAATTNAAMTNDIGVLTLNSMTFNAGSPVYTLGGSGLNFTTNGSGTLPSIVSNSSNSVTISVPLTLTNNLTVSGSGNVTLGAAIGGAGSLTMSGSGVLALSVTNTYSGGTNVLSGIIQVPSDAALGTGNVTGATLGTLSFTGTTATTKSFAMNGGTITVASGKTVTFNGSQVTGATLDGSGTFATNGAIIDNGNSTASVAIASNSAADRFVHFTNNGTLTFAAGLNPSISTAISNLNGFTNQGSGSVTIGAGSAINAANFQSYGTLTVLPNTTAAPTVFTNTGTAPLGFNGGSRTFIGTSATADPTGQNIVDYVDLHGQNAIVAGGLFVNNGGVFDTSMAGTATIIADFGSLVKGAGFYQNTVKTQNGGKFQTGNSPGSATFGNFVFGPGGVNNYVFAIDNATGAAGPSPGPSGLVSGWGLIKAVQASIGAMTTTGNFTWTATPSNPLTVAIDTLVNPTMSGTDVAGPMANFDPSKSYSWLAAQWTGSYAGPNTSAALDAATGFETNDILNPIAGTFGWNLDSADNTLSLVYTPTSVPEPGTLALTGLAGLAAGWIARRRRRNAGTLA